MYLPYTHPWATVAHPKSAGPGAAGEQCLGFFIVANRRLLYSVLASHGDDKGGVNGVILHGRGWLVCGTILEGLQSNVSCDREKKFLCYLKLEK